MFVRPEQRLAVSIITLAVHDARGGPEAMGARQFLAGPALNRWCEVLGVNPEVVRSRAPRDRRG